MSDVHGSCHCGAVRFSLKGEPISVVNCHCELCRSLSGAAFSTYVVVQQPHLLLEGEALVGRYQATEKANKHFCKVCGTPLFNTNPVTWPSLAMLYLGAVSSHSVLTPRVNTFCDSKLPWVDSVASIKGFPQAVVRGH